MANKDINVLFSKQYNANPVYFFPFPQMKCNWNILFAVYFHAPNPRWPFQWQWLDNTPYSIKALKWIQLWSEHSHVWYAKTGDQKQ